MLADGLETALVTVYSEGCRNLQQELSMKPSSSLKRILRIKQLIETIGLGKSTVYDYLDPKSPRYDPTFPKPVKLGVSAVGWVEEEVGAWLELKISMCREGG